MKIRVVKACVRCDGTGYVPCPSCSGTDENCPTCQGKREIVCVICDGLRAVPVNDNHKKAK